MNPRPARTSSRVVFIFLAFMLLHQADRLLIGPLKGPISETFGLNNFQFGLLVTGALVVGTVLYPVWGYLYDRYARAKLLALASLIWGSTTWLSAVAPTYPAFLVTRASTGIDDSSYPGLYSLVADYFTPQQRGRIYGLLQIAMPFGYLIGMVLALALAPIIGWRAVYYITGGLGILLALAIYRWVPEAPRGQAEPEFAGQEDIPLFRFSWREAREIFRRPTMRLLFVQGFFGVFPWNVLTYFFFDYLAKERGYNSGQVLQTMLPVLLFMALGYFLGGWLGDRLFVRTSRGRILVAITGVLFGMLFLALALNIPIGQRGLFATLLFIGAIFIPLPSANVIATVQDINPPEVRSTAQAIEYFIENSGAAVAPALAGWVADHTSMGAAILSVSIGAWLLCAVIFTGMLWTVQRDVKRLRDEMARRASQTYSATV